MKFRTKIVAIAALAALLVSAFALPVFADEAAAANNFFRPSVIIPIAIALAIVIACVIVFFVIPARREKTLKFFRGLKSEWKKITWYTWKQTWKGTLVVAIVSVVIAVVIGFLDYGFTQGINALSQLF